MSTCKKTAIEYQKFMLPYAEKAEKDAHEIVEALDIKVPKIYELIPPEGMKNKIKRFVYRIIED